jgi:hypothetical protein
MTKHATLQTIAQQLDRLHHELGALKGGLEAAFMQLTDEVSGFKNEALPLAAETEMCRGRQSRSDDDAPTRER